MYSKNKVQQIEVVYDPMALKSQLPVRNAAAMVVYNQEGKVLIVRRGLQVDEFKGAWSLPSSFIETHDENIAKTLQEKLQSWLSIEVANIRLIGKRMGIRPKWRLLMHLYLADIVNDPIIQTPKYDAFRWVDGLGYFSGFQYDKMGECTKAYLDHLNSTQEG